jgi:hypothetical protein
MSFARNRAPAIADDGFKGEQVPRLALSSMKVRMLIVPALAAFAVELAGCNGSNTIPSFLVSKHIYVTNGNSTAGMGSTNIYALPLSAAPTATGSLSTNTYPFFECTDGQGRVFVVNYTSGTIMAFTQPISNAASPAFTLNLAVASSLTGCVFDGSGNMYVSDASNNRIDVIPSPVSSSSTVTSHITASVTGPYGAAVDATGDVFVANGGAKTTEYASLGSGNTLLHTFGNNNFDNEGLVIGPDGNLYSANNTADGTIDVFKPPFTNATIVDHGITPPGATLIFEVKFDSSGNMYVSGNDAANSVVWVFAPPYTGAPTTAALIVVGTKYRAIGLALAP